MSEHPSRFALEAWHAGAPDPDVEAHVADCRGCRDYVDGLEAARKQFLERTDPADFVRDIRTKAEEPAPSARSPWARALRWLWLPALVVAAVLAFVLTPPQPPAKDDGIRFKGDPVQVAVIVDRAGAQTRHTADFEAKADARLRVEITVAEAAVLTVGVVSGDGFQTLANAVSFEAGEHLVGPALRIGPEPMQARVLAGPPAAVARALKGEGAPEVAVVRFTVAP